MKTDVLCIGTAVVDLLAAPLPDRKNWQEKQRIEKIMMMAGGDGANQSIRMADAGIGVKLAASIGTDENGIFLKSALQERGVNTEYVTVNHRYATGTSLVLVDQKGARNTFSVEGAHSMLVKEQLPQIRELKAEGIRAISIASLFSLPKLEKDGMEEYLKEAREEKIIVFADLGSDKLHQGLEGIRRFLPYIDYFLPSDYDICKMTGKDHVQKAAEILLQEGCGAVIVKCGEKGCFYSQSVETDRNPGVFVPAMRIEPADTTGAGDCMVALFVTRILKGDDPITACRYACTGASLSTLHTGASTVKITEEEIRRNL